jgi:23S rRNA G2445 N2-methylase RlmL
MPDILGKPVYILLPFAGSGTLYFETMICVLDLPGFFFGRDYAFTHFICHPGDSYRWMTEQVISDLKQKGSVSVQALLIDTDPGAIEEAGKNLKQFNAAFDRAGINRPDEPVIKQGDALAEPWETLITGSPQTVFLPLNPPFGRRLTEGNRKQLYRLLGRKTAELADHLHRKGTGLTGFLLCPDERKWREAGSEMNGLRTSTAHFSQGGRDTRLLSFTAE